MVAEFADVGLELVDAAGDGAAVFLQLGFARAAGADAAALAREAETPAAQARQAVAQLGQFHLQATGGAGGPLGKNIEDQLAAVADGQVQHPLQVAGLGGAQLPVGHHQGGAQFAGLQGRLHHLAFAPEALAGPLGAALLDHPHRIGASAAHQPLQFGDLALAGLAIAAANR